MRRILCALGVVTVLGATGTDNKDADHKGIQGTWKIAAVESNGMVKELSPADQPKLVFKGNRLTVNDDQELVFILDTSTMPRLIDFVRISGAEKGELVEGVYLLEKDTAKICIYEDRSLKRRPGQVRSAAGDGTLLLVLRRVKE